jgi:hypothetical protein
MRAARRRPNPQTRTTADGIARVVIAARSLGGWLGVLALLLLCAAFASPAAAAESEFDYLGSFGPESGETSEFPGAGGVAVDPKADFVYVSDRSSGSVYKFDLDGNPVDFTGSSANIAGNKLIGLTEPGKMAVDPVNGTIYVMVDDRTTVESFQPSGEPSIFAASHTNTLTGFELISALDVDLAGAIYVDGVTGNPSVFGSDGAVIVESDEPSLPAASQLLAVDANGVLYVPGSGNLYTYAPSIYPVTSDTKYTQGEVNWDVSAFSDIKVDRATTEIYVLETDRVRVVQADAVPVTSFGGPGEEGELETSSPLELAVHSESERAFVLARRNGRYRIQVFERQRCVCPPAIDFSNVSDVTADSATLRAEINPDTRPTTYWFEYGPEDCASGSCVKVPLAGAPLGSGHKPVAVEQNIDGLQPSTQYHYRVVAVNDLGTTKGPRRTFTTQNDDLGFALSDSRAWEMVSPPDKHGGSISFQSQGLIQASEEGNGLAYLTLGSIEAEPEGNRAAERSSVLARRGGSGWLSEDITPPHTDATGVFTGEYVLMTPDLSRSLLEARDDTPLSALTTDRTPYLRENVGPALYTPLLSSKEEGGNLPAGTIFANDSDLSGYLPKVMATNAALTTVAFRALPLEAGAPAQALYGWHGGHIQVVSELPADEGGSLVSGLPGSGLGSVRGAVSEDGSRIFWGYSGSVGEGYLAGDIGLEGLYLRDVPAEASVRLDEVQDGVGASGPSRPAFQAASRDGTVVFFTDSRRLTADASPEGRDLYRCLIPLGATADGCAQLSAVSAPPSGSGESAHVREQALALSEDGSRIYFVAEGVLDTAPNTEGDVALAGEPNLYVWQQGGGTRFVARLSDGDAPVWGELSPSIGYAGWVAADASPSGRYLAFMSERSLTGYANRASSHEQPPEEVFLYDAGADRLACVSCNPSNGLPAAAEINGTDAAEDGFQDVQLVDNDGRWQDRRLAAAIPQARQFGGGAISPYRPRSVLDNGRVYFNAFDSLVPVDSNGNWDVYQYEPTGLGSCTASSNSSSESRSGSGCVGLISSGTGEKESVFLDAGLSGDDVFFLSTAKLSALDEDAVYDVYDARVNGVVAQRPSRAECLGESCQPPASAPQEPTPGTATYQGPGDPKPKVHRRCPKGKRKVSTRKGRPHCVRRRHQQRNRKHQQRDKASRTRRAAR